MTNEEAIKEAKEFLYDFSYKIGNMDMEYLSEKAGIKMREALDVLIQALESQPKTGYWNILGDIWECSSCETMVMGYDGLNYCPNCGARMEDDENGI